MTTQNSPRAVEGIAFDRVEVANGQATCDDLELAIESASYGAAGLQPTPTRASERTNVVLPAAELQLVVGRRLQDVGEGDVVNPLDDDKVLQTVMAGAGALTLTDQRALGVVWKSDVTAKSLAVDLDATGSGSVLVFSVDRLLLRDLTTSRHWFIGQLRQAVLDGACFVHFAPDQEHSTKGRVDLAADALEWFIRSPDRADLEKAARPA